MARVHHRSKRNRRRKTTTTKKKKITIDVRRSTSPYFRKAYTVKCLDMITYTYVTCDPAEVDGWIYDVRSIYDFNNIIVGLGIQWCPITSRTIGIPLVATIQLCVNSFCLIYQVLHSKYRFPTSLSNFLGDDGITFAIARYNIDRPLYVDLDFYFLFFSYSILIIPHPCMSSRSGWPSD